MRLMAGYARADHELLDCFLRVERRGNRRPLLVVNERLLIANSSATELLGNMAHSALWGCVQRALASKNDHVVLHQNDAARRVRALLEERRSSDGEAGVLARLERDTTRLGTSTPGRKVDAAVADLNQRLPGRSPEWQAVVERAIELIGRGARILFVGESGVGKRALAVHALASTGYSDQPVAWSPYQADQACSGDWPTGATDWLNPEQGRCVFSRLDRLSPNELDALCQGISQLRPGSAPLLATYRVNDASTPLPACLAGQFPHVIEVPSLRERAEDIPDIAASVAAEPASMPAARVDPLVLQRLARLEWRGNVRQLRNAVLEARACCRGSIITDVPGPTQARAPMRSLTQMQLAERDAIVRTLAASRGNKLRAAARLGISRSTLYRKLRTLGLAQP
jgi:transcriptional regulator of acetoin/glycerol metabolism